MSMQKSITDFKLLSFDIYGTLIDWERGIYTALAPLLNRLPPSHPLLSDPLALFTVFNRLESTSQAEHPSQPYDELLTAVYLRFAQELQLDVTTEQAEAFGASVGQWPAFPDTVAAMQKLGRHYKLVVLSNVDRNSFSKTLAGPLRGVNFDAIYTAQDIGSYKPDTKNFEYLLQHIDKELGVRKEELLHTAQSLFHDHVPAKTLGLWSAWIARKGGQGSSAMGGDLGELEDKVGYSWTFSNLGEMAEEVEKQFAAAE